MTRQDKVNLIQFMVGGSVGILLAVASAIYVLLKGNATPFPFAIWGLIGALILFLGTCLDAWQEWTREK